MCEECIGVEKDQTCANCFKDPTQKDKIYGQISELCTNCFKIKQEKMKMRREAKERFGI